ncbi:MAG: hypothetical protein Q7J34_04020 [Bacteroidales bacterium]|nr:hypothetical protein [Bacteroidales bacterium]
MEEEIHTLIPVPLYLGLVGTMLGILIGVGFLVFSGGLNDLLNTSNGSGAKGIESLLGGVALAMMSSIVGISLTTYASYIAKDAKIHVEKSKNEFLSWIQGELLPNISNDTSSALVELTRNLISFNSAFAKNTQELQITLSQVSVTYQLQSELLKSINQLKIDEIATVNITVYEKLKNSTNEIGIFAQYLNGANQYLATIQSLNQKLDNYENRTQVIENAGKFFAKNEKWIAENFDVANLEVQKSLSRFNETTGESLTKLQESLNGQILNLNGVMQQQQERLKDALEITTDIVKESVTKTQQIFEKATTDQQQALNSKLHEITKLVDEVKNLTHIKEGIRDFKEATNLQSRKIEELAREIRALAKAKTDGGVISQEISFPKWLKVLTIAGGSLVAVTCLFYILPILLGWIINLLKWIL